MSNNMKLSVILPCYNEEESLPLMLERLTKVCKKCVGDSYEIICVNDGSSDNTLKVIRKAKPNIVAVDLFRNFGRESALLAGLHQVKGDRIFVLDADMQDPPEYLPDFMKKMDEGADIVFGRRNKRPGETFLKLFLAKIFYRTLSFFSDVQTKVDVGDFFLLTKEVVDILKDLPERTRFQRGLVAWIGGKQAEIVYDREARALGETKFPISAQLSLARDAITSFSIKPLRICLALAGLAIIIDIFLFVFVMIRYIYGDAVSGWASLGVIVLFFSAVQLVSLGIIGEYLGITYQETKKRPSFIVRSVTYSKK